MQTILDPAESAVAVTKSDTTVIPPTRALYIGGDGDLAVTMADGKQATFSGALAGSVLPLQVTQVRDATTATNIVAMY